MVKGRGKGTNARREQRGEQVEIVRRDDGHIVLVGRERLEDAHCSPPPANNDQLGLCRERLFPVVLLVAQVNLDDWQSLGPAEARVHRERIRRDAVDVPLLVRERVVQEDDAEQGREAHDDRGAEAHDECDGPGKAVERKGEQAALEGRGGGQRRRGAWARSEGQGAGDGPGGAEGVPQERDPGRPQHAPRGLAETLRAGPEHVGEVV